MEIKFYEKIGVKHFKRFLLWVEAKCIPDPAYRKVFNYNLKSISVSSAKSFKKMLILNGTLHFVAGIQNIKCIISSIVSGNVFSALMITSVMFLILNSYCVMLQRYNWLRIQKVLQKKTKIDSKSVINKNSV